MNTQNAEMDVESLQKSERRRGGCLDAFLVVSVMFLFAAVATLAVVGVMTVRDVESRLEPRTWTSEPSASMLTSGAAYTNFAYVEAITSGLKNATMEWHADQNYVGSNFKFNEDNRLMKPLRAGSYFIYINLNLTCTFRCNPGVFTIRVKDKMNCQVELPKLDNTRHVIRKCWTVSRVGPEQGLVASMRVPMGLEDWRLESSTGFGMFLVD